MIKSNGLRAPLIKDRSTLCYKTRIWYLSGMERTVRIVSMKARENDAVYWMSRTAEERLAAIEFLRQQWMGPDHAKQRLQRVCVVTQRARH